MNSSSSSSSTINRNTTTSSNCINSSSRSTNIKYFVGRDWSNSSHTTKGNKVVEEEVVVEVEAAAVGVEMLQNN